MMTFVKAMIVGILLVISVAAHAAEVSVATVMQQRETLLLTAKVVFDVQESDTLNKLAKELEITVPVYVSKYLQAIAVNVGTYIVFNEDALNQYPIDQLRFILAHEYGHSVRDSFSSNLNAVIAYSAKRNQPVRNLQDFMTILDSGVVAENRHQEEFGADAFAVKWMTAHGFDPIAPATAFFNSLPEEHRHDDGTHPSALTRIARIQAM